MELNFYKKKKKHSVLSVKNCCKFEPDIFYPQVSQTQGFQKAITSWVQVQQNKSERRCMIPACYNTDLKYNG